MPRAVDSGPPSHRLNLRGLWSGRRSLAPDDVYFLEIENYALAYMNFDWWRNDASGGP